MSDPYYTGPAQHLETLCKDLSVDDPSVDGLPVNDLSKDGLSVDDLFVDDPSVDDMYVHDLSVSVDDLSLDDISPGDVSEVWDVVAEGMKHATYRWELHLENMRLLYRAHVPYPNTDF